MRITRKIVRDLTVQLGQHCAPAVIAAQVRAAIEDLRGSVSLAALPEMTARLVDHRLSHPTVAAAS